MNKMGIIILVLYILSAIVSNTMIIDLTYLPEIASITFAVIAGVMFGAHYQEKRIIRIRGVLIKSSG